MLSFGQLIEEGHHVETCVLQQPEPQGRVFELLHIPAILEVLGQIASGRVLGVKGMLREQQAPSW